MLTVNLNPFNKLDATVTSLMPASHLSDADVLATIEDALWKDPVIRTLDRDSLHFEIHESEVYLSGHVTNAMHRRRIEDLISGVRGVNVIHTDITADDQLTTSVAQALASDARTRPYLIWVGAFHGWIRLSGEVPNSHVHEAAEEVAGRVSRVRGVLDLPHLPGERFGVERRPLQPHLATPAYAKDGFAGNVAQVVINPHNRLVSHLAVQLRPARAGYSAGEGEVVLVPVEAIEIANENSVFLTDGLHDLEARPVFHDADFPRAPTDWRPPFPYLIGTVRWLRL
jgi:osmotically-inducible protein OsmY